MIKYQNATRSSTEAVFVGVGDNIGGAAIFKGKTSVFTPAPDVKATMTAGSVRVTSPSEVAACGKGCAAHVDQSVEIRFNIQKGKNADLAVLVTEAERLLGIALAEYNLALGLVPPSEAKFGK